MTHAKDYFPDVGDTHYLANHGDGDGDDLHPLMRV